MGNFWDNDPVAQAPSAARAPAVAGAPEGAPGTMDYYKNFGNPPPSTALPNPGDPTSFSPQGSAAGMTTPSRISDDTLFALGLNAAEGGKNSASILNNDPGSAYAHNYALKQSDNDAAINLKQKMTAPMLDIIHGMREKLNAAAPGIADMATGPDYGALSDEPAAVESFGKAFLPNTSGEFYQNARAGIRNAINDTAGLIPGVSSFTQPWADRANAAQNLNLELHHLVKGIGAGVKAIPGVKGGGMSTDADQALVLDAVGEAMHSADTPTRNSIMFDAENILRARAGQQRLPQPPAGYKPTYLMDKYGAATPPAPPAVSAAPPVQRASAPLDPVARAKAVASAKNALAKGVPSDQVLQRLKELGVQ